MITGIQCLCKAINRPETAQTWDGMWKVSNGTSQIGNNVRIISLVLLATLLSSCNQTDLNHNFEGFEGFEGTFVLYDQNSAQYTIVNESRAMTRYSPFSTFKIPNSIIALESRIVSDVDQILTWDTLEYPKEDWWPQTWEGEHNLRSGIKYSVVPLYRTIASLIGTDQMQSYVTKFYYGNTDISSGVDNFWLNGSLKISAHEQVEFLRKFYNGELSVSEHSINSVKSILIQDSEESYSLSYKTGAGSTNIEKTEALGWLVGILEKKDNIYYFAMNIEGKSFEEVLTPRLRITKTILREVGIIS